MGFEDIGDVRMIHVGQITEMVLVLLFVKV